MMRKRTKTIIVFLILALIVGFFIVSGILLVLMTKHIYEGFLMIMFGIAVPIIGYLVWRRKQ